MQGQRKSGPRAAVRVGQGTSLPDGLETWLRRTNDPFPLRSKYLPINKARPGALLAKGRPQICSPPGEAAVLGLCVPGAFHPDHTRETPQWRREVGTLSAVCQESRKAQVSAAAPPQGSQCTQSLTGTNLMPRSCFHWFKCPLLTRVF